MNREQLLHAIRAAASAINAHDVVVIGSQAILASIPEHQLPIEATRSIEADVMSRDGNASDADSIDAMVGELSMFHETHGYYAQGVDLTTARLPRDWEQRLIPTPSEFPIEHPILGPFVMGWCLEAHDLWAGKAIIGREKDLEFCAALVRFELVDPVVCMERVELIDSIRDEERDRARRLAKTAFG